MTDVSHDHRSTAPFWRCFVALVAFVVCSGIDAFAAEGPQTRAYQEDFEGEQISGKISADNAESAHLRAHVRSSQNSHTGQQAEVVQIDCTTRGGRLYLEYETTPALVFDELVGSIWIRSNRPGMQIGVRVVFPHQVNPLTGNALTADLWGEIYSQPHRWQQIGCRTQDAAVKRMLGRLRNQYASSLKTSDIDAHGMYVDRIILSQQLEAGASEYAIDTLELSPLIDPASNGASIVQASVEEEVVTPVTMGDGHLRWHGRPMFPVFTPYHGESLEGLKQSGFNLIWVPNSNDTELLNSLAEHGLGAMAEPPAMEVQPPEVTGDVSYNVGLPKFTAATSNIVMWHLGSEVPPEGLASVRAAAAAIRNADPYRRPIMVDVSGAVREFHRAVDIVGFSKHSVHTSTSPQSYLQFLEQESLQALRGKPCCTWIFTEPNRANLGNHGAVPQVEPEQIWMQVYAALGAGTKAIGYWKLSSADDSSPQAVERRSAVTLANLQIQLLHDWLATGKVVDLAPVRMGTSRGPIRQGVPSTLITRFNRNLGQNGPADQLDAEVFAPVLRCDQGILILPQWLEKDGQYQQGPMSAEDVRIQIRDLSGATHAWEVTTTGVQAHTLNIEEINGGTEITVKRLDQLMAIVIPMDPAVIEPMRRQANAIKSQAAEQWVSLATAKLERVQTVHDILQQQAPKGVRDGDYILAEARRQLRTAAQQLQARNYDGARVASEAVLRLTRQVQRAHWENAARTFSSPVSTPYSVCFQTLPEFWKLMQEVGRGQPNSENLLRGGSFENWDSIFAAGWRYDSAENDSSLVTLIELAGDGANGRCLRLAARPADPTLAPVPVSQPPAKFITHPIPVFSGQIVHIKGLVRIDVPITGSPEGLLIYDNLQGSVGGVRWAGKPQAGGWQPFELIRPVQHSGELHLVMELKGYGDIRIDELQVTTINR